MSYKHQSRLNFWWRWPPHVLRGMGLTHLAKNANARKELADKGMAVE